MTWNQPVDHIGQTCGCFTMFVLFNVLYILNRNNPQIILCSTCTFYIFPVQTILYVHVRRRRVSTTTPCCGFPDRRILPPSLLLFDLHQGLIVSLNFTRRHYSSASHSKKKGKISVNKHLFSLDLYCVSDGAG